MKYSKATPPGESTIRKDLSEEERKIVEERIKNSEKNKEFNNWLYDIKESDSYLSRQMEDIIDVLTEDQKQNLSSHLLNNYYKKKEVRNRKPSS